MRISETYPAVVTSNEDPEFRGRIRVACAALMGDEESELPHWVEPIFNWGWFYIPDVGELIEIEVTTSSDEDESFEQFSIDNLSPRWRGDRFYGNEEGESPSPIPNDFSTNYGKRRGFATPGGHILIFDDTDGKRSVSLTWTNESGDQSLMTFDNDGSFKVSTHTGHVLFMDAAAGELSITDSNGNKINCNSTGVSIESAKIQLGGTSLTEALIFGTTFINSIYNTHTHPTGVGPSGPPTTPAPSSVLSTKVFTG